MASEQYDRVSFHGKFITRRQRQALRAVEKKVGEPFVVYQGSWRPYTSYSGTSHTGAGACDIWMPGLSTDKPFLREVLHRLRDLGRQAAFVRGPFTNMPWHFHVLDLDLHGMDSHVGYGGVWQVGEYRAGHDGLVAGRPDPFPYRPDPIRRWRYRA